MSGDKHLSPWRLLDTVLLLAVSPAERGDKGAIKTVMKSEEGMVLVFDGAGEQLPEYQGDYAQVRERILAEAPPGAEFYHVSHSLKRVPRQDW